jgi:hypothetical protein
LQKINNLFTKISDNIIIDPKKSIKKNKGIILPEGILKIRLLTVLLILSGVSITALEGCDKKPPIIIYKTPEPNSNGAIQNTRQPVYTQPIVAQPAPADDSGAVAEEPAPADDTAAEAPPETPASATAPVAAEPDPSDSLDIPDALPSYAPAGGDASGSAGYTQAGSFNIYQPGLTSKIPLIGSFLDSTTTVNKWQAVGVAAFGSDIFITAQDKSGLTFFKGTVLKMNAADGTGFTNLGSQWLGVHYQMDPTVRGIAMDSSGNIYANDKATFLYLLNQPDYSVQKINAGLPDAIDIAAAGTSVYVATSAGLKKYESTSLTTGTDFAAGVTPTGGIGSDAAGNLYVVASGVIKKITASGSVSDAISGVTGAIDVVGTDDNKICVLTSEGVKMYDASGKLLSTFGQGEYLKGTAIAASGKDLYVSDEGTSYKDSKIVKYSVMSL